MEITFERGTIEHIDEIELLYNKLNDYLEMHINYPGWKKGIYPIRENAVEGISEGNLFIAKYLDKIVGSVILSHKPEAAYEKAAWLIDADYDDIIVIHTLVVHPDYIHCGVGKAIMDFAVEYSSGIQAKSIRLDVYEGNIPAIHLYEKCGFTYINTVDLGLGNYGLNWFKLYEKLLQNIIA